MKIKWKRAGPTTEKERREEGFYWDYVYHGVREDDGSSVWLTLLRIGDKYYVSSNDDDSPPEADAGPFNTLREAKIVAETCIGLDQPPTALEEWIDREAT